MSATEDDIDASRAPLLDHLIELRQRLVRCVIALLVSFGICFYFSEHIFSFLVVPLKVAIFAAFCLSFPVIMNQLWAFVAPGLYRQEKRALLPFLFATPVLFTAGAALAYYVVMPTAFHFFLKFQGEAGGLSIEALPSTDAYLSLVMQFILAFGISFLLPVLLMLLNRAGIVSRAQLISLRRYMIVAAFIVAAVLTPPDVVSQLMLAIPLILLYELSIIAIWFTDRKAVKDKPAEEAAEVPAEAQSEPAE